MTAAGAVRMASFPALMWAATSGANSAGSLRLVEDVQPAARQRQHIDGQIAPFDGASADVGLVADVEVIPEGSPPPSSQW